MSQHILQRSPAKAVLLLGLPLALASFFQAGFNLTEVWVFGQTGDGGASLSGAAVSDLLTAVFALLANGMANAAVAQISRATGAGDEARAAAAARGVLFVGLVLSVGSALVGAFAAPLGELLMSDSARPPGVAFLRIMGLGGAGTVFMVITIGILRARGDTVVPLILIATVSIATLGLEAAFILGWFGLDPHGIEAAAWVTVILRILTALWGYRAVSRQMNLKPPGTRAWVDRTVLREQLSLGFLSAIQQSLRVFGMLALVGLSTWLLDGARGESIFRALTLWTKVDIPMIMMAMAWGGGAAPAVGMLLGAGREKDAGRAAWTGAGIAAGAAVVNALLVFFFAPALIGAFVPDDPSVVADTLELLDHVAPFYPLMAMGIAIGFAFNGAGDMRRPLIWDAALLLVFQGGLAGLLVGTGLMAEGGFFVVLAISGAFQGAVPIWFLRHRRWQAAAEVPHDA